MNDMSDKLKLIKGGRDKYPVRLSPSVRLYRAYSIGDYTRDDVIYHDVRFNWYRLERDEPAAPYETLIADHDRLNERDRMVLQADVDRYLTEEEVKVLGEYLGRTRAQELFVFPVTLPVSGPGSILDSAESIVFDFVQLSEEKEYDLPFRAWGYFSLERCITSPSLANGVTFLRRAMEILGIEVNVSEILLEATVKAIHDRDRLLVKSVRGKN